MDELTEDIRLLQQLERWRNEHRENTLSNLAEILGYGSSTVISHWIHRRRIPRYMREPLRRIVGKGVTEYGDQSPGTI